MSIKTWEERYDPDGYIRGAARTKEAAMQAEIDDLRAALQERELELAQITCLLSRDEDFEKTIAERDTYIRQLEDETTPAFIAQRKVLEQSKLALEKNLETLVAGVTYDITKNTIATIQEQLK